ncbi:NACHT domain-containing protein [Candidatus Venteria ishoeyi]|uniref:NACHT domain protein n=1 Tax=Candidatus Venteria ishoeyi TaxID=1899563 RepID=A0A1H6F5E4_9GAMM|nr:hypothetical protein [Candidatus Venteria ishoeyi]SEH04225.1 Uncharacterised protein [Candidatus Venteria ishoeyi]
MSKYIELNRTFFDFSDNEDTEDAALRSYITSLHHAEINWSQLLQGPCVVLLGEAGSGKTWEMAHQVEAISQVGGYAFFLRLEQLLNSSTELTQLASFSHQQREKYSTWCKQQKQTATFFLDAKDEAVLKSSHALQDALNNFTALLGITSLLHSPVKVILSCRVSEWRPNSDLDTVRRCFDLPEENPNNVQQDKSIPNLRIVQLAPLDREKIKCYVEAKGLTDSGAFLQTVDARRIWSLLGRPLDVHNFLNYWQQYGQLGTLCELLEYDIEYKLAQHGDTHTKDDPLTTAKSRQAAEALAAATLLCKEFKFALPDNEFPSQGIAPKAVLPIWDNHKINYVLNRPLFDEAIYGHVRFHHRQAAEYLAAHWLHTLFANASAVPDIESLLFVKSCGQFIVPPSRAPAVAWLAVIKNETWNQHIRQRLVQEHPEILLRHGDPQSLSIEDRRQLLIALMEKYQNQQRTYIDTDRDKLALFAVPELAETINGYLLDNKISFDLQILLLKMVRDARLPDCVAATLDIMQQPETHSKLKTYAAMAICEAGSTQQHRQLISIIQGYTALSKGIATTIVEKLYPNIINSLELIEIIELTEKIDFDSTSALPYMVDKALTSRAPEADLELLLHQFIRLLTKPPFIEIDKKPEKISEHYVWLVTKLGVLIKRLLNHTELSNELIHHLIIAFEILKINNRIISLPKHKTYLLEESKQHPVLRQAYTWHCIHALKLSNKDKLPLWLNIFEYYSPLKGGLQLQDIDWLIADSINLQNKLDREIAFSLAVQLWNISRKYFYRKQFYKALKILPELKPIWQNNINTFSWYFSSYWNKFLRHYDLYDLKWKLRHDLSYKLKDKWQQVKNYFWVMRHLSGLRTGKEWYALSTLSSQARSEDFTKWGEADWQSLRSKYGSLIANAARAGWKAYWHTFTPLLPHEKSELNQTDRRVILGLTGLYTDFADGLEATSLSVQEARLAAMYAVNELNGFPDWFNPLAKVHPNPVREVLLSCIQAEWQTPTEREHVHEVLSKLTYAAPSLQTMVCDEVLSLLLQTEPQHDAILTQALKLIFNQPVAEGQAALSQVAQQCLQTLTSDAPAFMMWLMIWLQLEAVGAMDFLQANLKMAENPDKFMEKLCAVLQGCYDEGYPLVKNPAYLQAEILETLIPLVYQHIRLEDDPIHQGAYWAGERDKAQDFRCGLLPKLADISTPEACQALTRLAKHPLLADSRDWITKLLVDNAESGAEQAAWKPQQVAEFATRFEKNTQPEANIQNQYIYGDMVSGDKVVQDVQGDNNTFSGTGDIKA